MTTALKKLDFVGLQFELNFGRNDRHKTCFGGMLTLLAFSVVIFACVGFLKKLFDTTEVDVSTSIQFNEKYPQINLTKSAIYPAIYITTERGGLVDASEIPNYFTIVGLIETFNYTSLSNKSTFTTETLQPMPFKPCKDITLQIKKDLYGGKESVEYLGEKSSYCGDLTNMTNYYVQGNLVNPAYTYMDIMIFPCSMANSKNCASEEKISSAEISLIVPEVSFDPENRTHPVKILPTTDLSFAINPFVSTDITFQLKTTEIKDDALDYVGEQDKDTFYDIDRMRSGIKARKSEAFHCPLPTITSEKCEPYISMRFQATGRKVVIKRDYAKYLDTMGEMGGYNDFMFMLVGFLYLCYSCRNTDPLYQSKTMRHEVEQIDEYIPLEPGMGKEIRKEVIEESIEELMMQRQDGLEMFRTLNRLFVIETVLFKDYHKKLIPLALINHNAMLLRDCQSKDKELDEHQHLYDLESEELTHEQAIAMLKASNPMDKISRGIKEFLMKNLVINKGGIISTDRGRLNGEAKFGNGALYPPKAPAKSIAKGGKSGYNKIDFLEKGGLSKKSSGDNLGASNVLISGVATPKVAQGLRASNKVHPFRPNLGLQPSSRKVRRNSGIMLSGVENDDNEEESVFHEKVDIY